MGIHCLIMCYIMYPYMDIPCHVILLFCRYAALIISLMAKDCRYLLETLLYNPDLYEGTL